MLYSWANYLILYYILHSARENPVEEVFPVSDECCASENTYQVNSTTVKIHVYSSQFVLYSLQ